MFLSHQRKQSRWPIMHHSCALQLWSTQTYSAQIFSVFDHGLLVWFDLAWFGVFVGFVFPKSGCKQDRKASNPLNLHPWQERRNLKSFYSVNIKANITVLLLQSLKCFSFSETRGGTPITWDRGLSSEVNNCVRPIEEEMWKQRVILVF